MKNLILTGMLVLGITVSLFAQEIPFVFDKNRIDVGTVYGYELSANKEESNFEPTDKEYFYLKTLNEIEVLWIPIDSTKATDWERYKMNWKYMMFENRESLSLENENELRKIEGVYDLKATINIDFSRRTISRHYKQLKKGKIVEWGDMHRFKSIPTYFYRTTELVPLWFVLRFYPLGKKEVSVNQYMGGLNSKLDIKYLGKEKVEVPFGKILCYKFELVPKMSFAMKMIFKPKKAWIWLTSEDERRYMVKYRNNNWRATFYPNMEYRLFDIKKMTSEEWGEFKQLGLKVK